MALVDGPDVTRERLIAAAAEVFGEKGYDRAGVQEIARRAGLTTGAIYGRFTGKAELLQAAIESHTDDEFDVLFAEHAFEGHASDIIRTVGAHLVTPPADCDEASGALLLEAFVAARRDTDMRDLLVQLMDERADRMGEVVEVAKADGSIDPDLDTDSLVRFCHAVGLGFLLYDALGVTLPKPEPWEQLITRLVGAVAPTGTTHEGNQH